MERDQHKGKIRLTISVDEKMLTRAHEKALERNTTVEQVLRDYLDVWTGARAERVAAAERVLAVAEQISPGSGGVTWTRADLYDRGSDKTRGRD